MEVLEAAVKYRESKKVSFCFKKNLDYRKDFCFSGNLAIVYCGDHRPLPIASQHLCIKVHEPVADRPRRKQRIHLQSKAFAQLRQVCNYTSIKGWPTPILKSTEMESAFS